MKPFILLLFILSFHLSFSQRTQNVDVTSELIQASRNLSKSNTVLAEGSPYINAVYSPVKIASYGNMIFSARYNANNGDMEVIVKNGAKPIALDIKAGDYEVTFMNTKKTYKSYTYKNKADFYVNLLSNADKISLLKKENIAYVPKKISTSSYVKDKPARFKRVDDTFFIIKPGKESLTPLPKKKKEIAKLFSNRKNEVLAFIKENSIKTSNEEDVIKLINFLNQ